MAGGGVRVRVVSSYVHLGSVLASDANANSDVSRRVGSAMATYVPLSSALFGNAQFSRPLRYQLFLSLVVSRLVYNLACWDVITPHTLTHINTI